MFICDYAYLRAWIYFHWWRNFKISRSKSIILSSFETASPCRQVFTSTDGEMLKFPTRNAFLFSFVIAPPHGHVFISIDDGLLKFPDRNPYFWVDLWLCSHAYKYLHPLIARGFSSSKLILLFSFMTVSPYGHVFTSTHGGMLQPLARMHPFEFICNCVILQICIYIYWWLDVKISTSKFILFFSILLFIPLRTCI